MNTPTTRHRIGRALAWLLTLLTGALLFLLTSPAPAMACGVSYETGTDPNTGCSGTAPVAGSAAVGLAALVAVGIAVAKFPA